MKPLIKSFILSTLVSFCSSSSILLAQDEPTFDLHAAFALTGIGASFGNVEVNGATLAIEQFNKDASLEGKKVKLIVEDTQSTNVHTLSAIRKLSSFNKAKIILGPTWLDSYQSVLPIAEKEGILLFTPSAAVVVFKKAPEQYPTVFSTWFNLELEIKLLLSYIKKQGKERLMLAFDQDPFFQTIRSIVQQESKSLDLEIVSDSSFDLHSSDFRTILMKSRSSKADCAIFGFGDEANLLTFLKQRKELNPDLQLFGTDYLDGYVSQEKLLSFFEKVDFISPQVKDRVFSAAYHERFSAPPVLSASTAYDATSILLTALKAGNKTPNDIRSYLLANEFDTATFGKVKFNSFGGVQSSHFVIKKVRSNTITEEPISN